jgi:sn-glycerol 3-phosphate transport system substrate-binding protein
MAVAVLTLGLLAAACGGGRGAPGASGVPPSADCPVGAVAAKGKRTEVSMWHFVANFQGEPTLKQLTADFNRSHPSVRVTLRQFQSDNELAAAYLDAVAGHKPVPDLVELHGDVVRAAIDRQLVLPVQTCLDGDHQDLGDFLPQAVAGSRIGSTQWGLPIGAWTDVLLYDRRAFERAGLDPDRPPATLAQLRSDARALVGAGVAHPVTGWAPLDLYGVSGVNLADADNGHTGDATEAAFDTADGRAIARWAGGMWDEKLFYELPAKGDWRTDLLPIGKGEAAVTIHDTHDLKDVANALAQGQAPDASFGAAPVPSLHGPPGVVSPTDAMYLTRSGSSAGTGASWIFLRWLTEPSQQARWHQGSTFFPVRRSAAADPGVQQLWSRLPVLAQAWKVLDTAAVAPESLTGAGREVLGELLTGRLVDPDPAVTVEQAFAGKAARATAHLAAYQKEPLAYVRCAVRSRPPGAGVPQCPDGR